MESSIKKTNQPRQIINVTPTEPPVYYYSYANRDSQGALLKETEGFPASFDMRRQNMFCLYQDRADRNKLRAAYAAINAKSQNWVTNAQTMTDDDLKAFAKTLMGVKADPLHVRIVFYYNVATGYPCPRLDAIFKK